LHLPDHGCSQQNFKAIDMKTIFTICSFNCTTLRCWQEGNPVVA
jgi:hypothetical protein